MYIIVMKRSYEDSLPGIYDTRDEAVQEVNRINEEYAVERPELLGTLSVVDIDNGKVVY